MNQNPDAFGFFAGIGVLVFLSCCGRAIVQYAKYRFGSNPPVKEPR